MVIICKYEGCDGRMDSPTLFAECPQCHGHWLEEGEDYEILNEVLVGFRLICTLTQTASEYVLTTDGKVLGRADFDWIGERKAYISGRHCEVVIEEGQLWLTDLNSTNGTSIGLGNNEKLQTRTTLADKTYLILGRETFLVQYLYEEESPQPVTPTVVRCMDCMTILSESTPCVCDSCGAWNE